MFPLQPPAAPVRLARIAMRSRFEVLVADLDRTTADCHAAASEALGEIVRSEGLLSVYQNGSDLFTANAHAASRPIRLDTRVFDLLVRAQELWTATDGAFDLTVGPLLQLWGLTSGSGVLERLPTPEEIGAACEQVGMGHVIALDKNTHTITFRADGVRLDPGAIGKGWALDQAAEALRDAGMHSCLLHGGTSTVCALGSPPNSPEGWTIAVQDPRKAEEAILATVSLRDAALSVSAISGKTVEVNGQRYGHIIDPRTGWPVTRALLAAVVTASATDSDALSTALLVSGAAGIPRLQAPFPDAAFLVVETGASDSMYITATGDRWRLRQ